MYEERGVRSDRERVTAARERSCERDRQQRQADRPELGKRLEIKRVSILDGLGDRACREPVPGERAGTVADERSILEGAPGDAPIVSAVAAGDAEHALLAVNRPGGRGKRVVDPLRPAEPDQHCGRGDHRDGNDSDGTGGSHRWRGNESPCPQEEGGPRRDDAEQEDDRRDNAARIQHVGGEDGQGRRHRECSRGCRELEPAGAERNRSRQADSERKPRSPPEGEVQRRREERHSRSCGSRVERFGRTGGEADSQQQPHRSEDRNAVCVADRLREARAGERIGGERDLRVAEQPPTEAVAAQKHLRCEGPGKERGRRPGEDEEPRCGEIQDRPLDLEHGRGDVTRPDQRRRGPGDQRGEPADEDHGGRVGRGAPRPITTASAASSTTELQPHAVAANPPSSNPSAETSANTPTAGISSRESMA